MERLFDRGEIGLSVEWITLRDEDRLAKLQATNRFLTNEKSKYLTILESLSSPVFFLDKYNRIDNVNRAASTVLGRSGVPGAEYCCLLRDRYLEYQDGVEQSIWRDLRGSLCPAYQDMGGSVKGLDRQDTGLLEDGTFIFH